VSEKTGSTREFRYAFEARDYDAAVAFYRDRLGLAIVDSWDRGEDRGTLFPAASGVVEVLALAGDLLGPRKRGIVVEVDDVNRLYERLQAEVTVVREISTQPWGFRDFGLIDPDGNAVIFFSRMQGGR
jgi:catechol 2,3-dioxygenase-like lactoylglutathione lyase family enzyme